MKEAIFTIFDLVFGRWYIENDLDLKNIYIGTIKAGYRTTIIKPQK